MCSLRVLAGAMLLLICSCSLRGRAWELLGIMPSSRIRFLKEHNVDIAFPIGMGAKSQTAVFTSLTPSSDENILPIFRKIIF